MGDLTEHFSVAEFACPAHPPTPVPDKYLPNLRKLAARWEVIRHEASVDARRLGLLGDDEPDASIIVLPTGGGYRTEEFNEACHGAPESAHRWAKAMDGQSPVLLPLQLLATIERCIKDRLIPDGGVECYVRPERKYGGWVHYDIGRPRRWEG